MLFAMMRCHLKLQISLCRFLTAQHDLVLNLQMPQCALLSPRTGSFAGETSGTVTESAVGFGKDVGCLTALGR